MADVSSASPEDEFATDDTAYGVTGILTLLCVLAAGAAAGVSDNISDSEKAFFLGGGGGRGIFGGGGMFRLSGRLTLCLLGLTRGGATGWN